jgi:uncharacterized protein (TIGR02391 family)
MSDVTGLESLLAAPQLLLALEPEEVGGYIIEYLNERPGLLDRATISIPMTLNINPLDLPADVREDILRTLTEAWHWLEREGLVLRRPFAKGFFITRRGERLSERQEVRSYLASSSLNRELLHPRLVQVVWPAVLRGDYDNAVFQAFRQVEIAVRAVAKLPESEVGIGLMRKAFAEGGPLSLGSEPKAEQEALSHLFAGAVGRFKNPSSHRTVEYTLTETAEALMLASLLMRIVAERAPKP